MAAFKDILVIVSYPSPDQVGTEAPSYLEPNGDTLEGKINPAPASLPNVPSTVKTVITKFIEAEEHANFNVQIKVGQNYDWETVKHDFVKITIFVDGSLLCIHTVAPGDVDLDFGKYLTIGGVLSRNDGAWNYHELVWVLPEGFDRSSEMVDFDEWNHDLGTIRVLFERMKLLDPFTYLPAMDEIPELSLSDSASTNLSTLVNAYQPSNDLTHEGVAPELPEPPMSLDIDSDDDLDDSDIFLPALADAAQTDATFADEVPDNVLPVQHLSRTMAEHRCITLSTATENTGPVPDANPATIPEGTNVDGGEAFFEVEFKYRTKAMLEKVAEL